NHGRAGPPIGPASGLKLKLSIAASQLGVHGRDDETCFADHVGVDDIRREGLITPESSRIARAVAAETVDRCVHDIESQSTDGVTAGLAAVRTLAKSRQDLDKIEHILSDDRKLANLLFG